MLFGKSQSTAEKMKALGEAYAASLPGKLHELETLAQPLSGGGPFEELHRALEAVRILAHKIAGTAGTFGYQSITDGARAIEKSLQTLLEAKQALAAEQAAEIEARIEALKSAAQQGLAADSGRPRGATAATEAAAEFVILLAPPGETADLLARQITDSGYRVHRIAGQGDKVDDVGRARARAILLHAALPDGPRICRRLSEILRKEARTDVPIIFLSDSGDFQTRLQAVRCGAKAFIVAPPEARTIVGKIEELARSMPFAPHRVLIVEDDDMLALQCSSAFGGPGYASRVVKEPSELLDRLETFDPDLVVMDLSVAGMSGLDLAKVVWQHDDFRDIAILFLTPGPEFNAQLLQLGLSDEFFIPRPLDVHALRAMATRYLAGLRSGRRAANFGELFAHLDRIAEMTASKDKPRGKADERNTASADSVVAPQPLPKILVVDDDRHLVDAIAIKLSGHGFDVLKAFSGKQGLRVAWEEHPCLVITDYLMPDGSGDYLLTRLKTEADTQDIPIMIITAHTIGGQKDYALERDFLGRLGAASFLAKPIDLDTLVAEVSRTVRLPSGKA